MSRESDPFIGPAWAKLLLGWGFLVLGGLIALFLVALLVAGIVVGLRTERDLWAGTAIIAFWASLFGMAAVAGWQILRVPSRPVRGKGPPGGWWIAVGGLAMIPLLWILSEVLVGSRPLHPSAAYVMVGWWALFLLTSPALRRFQALRGSPIRWWEWGLVQGLLAGSAATLEVFLAGRGIWLSLVGGLVIGLIFFAAIGGYFLWWERVGRDWYVQQGGRLRWPLS